MDREDCDCEIKSVLLVKIYVWLGVQQCAPKLKSEVILIKVIYLKCFHFIILFTLGLNGQASFEYSTTNYVDPAFSTPPDSWKYVPSCLGPRIGSK